MCHYWEFTGGPVVRTWHFHSHGSGSIPDQETKTPQALPHSQKDNKMCHYLKLVIWLHQIPASEVKWKSLSCVQLFATPRTIQSVEFSRPEYWSV